MFKVFSNNNTKIFSASYFVEDTNCLTNDENRNIVNH